MKLYYAPGACSLSPHIVLREAGVRFDLERVDLKTHRTASGADFLRINPKGDVPALELDGPDRTVLTEGPAIVQYIADLVPEAHLVPPSETLARYHLQAWLNFIATELEKPVGPMFGAGIPARVAAQQRGTISQRLLYLQDVLSDRAFLMGEAFTVADAYLFVMLPWCRSHGIDLGLYPNLEDYEQRIASRPAVRAALSAEGQLEHHLPRRSA